VWQIAEPGGNCHGSTLQQLQVKTESGDKDVLSLVLAILALPQQTTQALRSSWLMLLPIAVRSRRNFSRRRSVRVERRPELSVCVEHATLDRSEWELGAMGDLGLAEPFVVCPDEQLTVLPRKQRKLPADSTR